MFSSDQSKRILEQLLSLFRGGTNKAQVEATITSGTITETNSAAIAASLSVIDDWDSSDAAKTVGITTVVKKTGAQIGADGAAYASGDVVGDQGAIVLAAARFSGGSGIIHSVVVKDLTKQSSALDIVVFDSNPSNSTFTDNAACDIADGDIDKVIGVINVAASDYAAFNDNSVANVKGINLPFIASGSANLYFVVVSRGTPTYVADELSIAFGILQD